MQPANVTGELDLTQSLAGPADNGTAATRGYTPVSSGVPNYTNSSQVWLLPAAALIRPVTLSCLVQNWWCMHVLAVRYTRCSERCD